MGYKVILGHLVSNENGKSTGGKPGDQTGKESRRQAWYKSGDGWENVFRAKSAAKADIIAKTMEDICDNPKAGGYNQLDRLSLFEEAAKVDFDISKITKPCNSDCSAGVAVCVNAAGIKVSKDMYTGNEKKLLESTGKFKTLTASKYISKPDNLKRGDILHREGHTAVVLSNTYVLTRNWYYNKDKMMKGEEVKKIQSALNTLTDAGLEVDGEFGRLTSEAVARFQHVNNITADGIVGRTTAKYLGFGYEG